MSKAKELLNLIEVLSDSDAKHQAEQLVDYLGKFKDKFDDHLKDWIESKDFDTKDLGMIAKYYDKTKLRNYPVIDSVV